MSTWLPTTILAILTAATPAQAWPWSSDPKPTPPARLVAAPAPDADLRATIAFLDVAKSLSRGCEDAAWSLWWSNDYLKWRNRESRSFSMNQSASILRGLPKAPPGLDPAVSAAMLQDMGAANDTIQDSANVFHDMANYINAKDYQDDKFKKGDVLNARLLEIGKTCHALSHKLRHEYREAAQQVIEAELAKGGRPAIARTMFDDWRSTQRLSDAMATYTAADLDKIGSLAAEISTLVETRHNEIKLGVAAPRTPVTAFYGQLEERVGVKSRKMVREMKQQPKVRADEAADRPRSDFNQLRETIDMQMPQEILQLLRNGVS